MTDTAPRNAIDTALIKLNTAAHYLELNRPSKKDVKSVSDAAKDAADILKASLVLLDHDCYSVQDPPSGAAAPGTPLFKPSGEPSEAAAPSPAAPAEPEIKGALGCIDVEIVSTEDVAAHVFGLKDRVKYIAEDSGYQGCIGVIDEVDDSDAALPFHLTLDHEGDTITIWASDTDIELLEAAPVVARKFKIGDHVKASNDSAVHPGTVGEVTEDDGNEEDNAPYAVRFHGEKYESYCDAADLDPATDEEWEVAHSPANEPFPSGTKTAQKKVFDERLATLEEIFCERLDLAGSTDPRAKQLKQFRPHLDAWKAGWKADPRATWKALVKAVAEANASSEFATWAPAA